MFSWGSFEASADQILPVPPEAGNRKVEFGPQPTSSVCVFVLCINFSRLLVATRSPTHSADN